MSVSEALVPEIFNLTLTTADTEYVQPLSQGTKYYSAQCRTGEAIRFAFETGKVATPTSPYATIKAGGAYNTPEKMGFSIPTAIAHVQTLTVADTWASGDTVALTIDGNTVTVTIGSLTTTTQVATTIKQAWENEARTDTTSSVSPSTGGQFYSRHAEITATSAAAVVTLTQDNAGRQTGLSVAATTAGDGDVTLATTQSPWGNVYFAGDTNGLVVEMVAWKDLR